MEEENIIIEQQPILDYNRIMEDIVLYMALYG